MLGRWALPTANPPRSASIAKLRDKITALRSVRGGITDEIC
jgi:hypothetical protein